MHIAPPDPDPRLDLVLERTVALQPERIWAAWTRPEHVVRWFTPAPWTTVDCTIDLRPGGVFRTVMRSPEGQEHEHAGCWLEIVEHRRLVWTDALGPGFRPSAQPFVTAVVTLEPVPEGTRYTAVAMHRDEAARRQHEAMGFVAGWGAALDQLVAHMSRQP